MLIGVQPRISHRYRDISSENFDCSPFDLGRANGHQKGRWPTIHVDLPSYKISARSCKRSTRYALQYFFHFLAPGGLTPGPKFTKRGDDLADTEVYHPPKFHRRKSTHAGDIRYKNPADKEKKQKNKQTVNDISTACLSACVENNDPQLCNVAEGRCTMCAVRRLVLRQILHDCEALFFSVALGTSQY